MPSARRKPLGKVLAYGAVSLLLYVVLFVWEDQILRWTTKGKWFFFLPVAIAFLFSFFHGSFAGNFWEALGVQAKPAGETKKK